MSIATTIWTILREVTLGSILSLAGTLIMLGLAIAFFVRYPWYLALSAISLCALYSLTRGDLKAPPVPDDDDEVRS